MWGLYGSCTCIRLLSGAGLTKGYQHGSQTNNSSLPKNLSDRFSSRMLMALPVMPGSPSPSGGTDSPSAMCPAEGTEGVLPVTAH